MDNYTEIRNKIRAMMGQKTPLLLTGKVESVGDETCTIIVGDLKLTDVRLRSVVNGESSKLLIKPAKDSYVTIIDLSGELRETEVIGYSQIEAIDIETGSDININCKGDTNIDCDGTVTFNGGDHDGLVKLQELKDNLNSIKNYLSALKSAISTGLNGVGISTAASGEAGALAFEGAMAGKTINFKNMENDKVKH